MSATLLPTDRYKPQTAEYRYVQSSVQFQEFRSTFRSFAIPMTVAGLVRYTAFVLLVTFAPDLMVTPVPGSISLGIVLGLFQLVTTLAITWMHINFASRKLESMQVELCEALESGEITGIVAKKEAWTY